MRSCQTESNEKKNDRNQIGRRRKKNQCLQRHLAMRFSPRRGRNLPLIRFFACDFFFCGLKVDKLLHGTSATGPKYRHKPGTGISALAINRSQLSKSGSVGRQFDSRSPGFSLFAIAARSMRRQFDELRRCLKMDQSATFFGCGMNQLVYQRGNICLFLLALRF